MAPFELKNTSELAFPDYRRVAPEKAADDAKHKTASVCQRFNGDYLARIGHVQKALKSKNGARLQFSNGNSGEPLRADIVGAMGEATVIIMGMRL